MPKRTAVLLRESRTAVDSQDFDLRKGALITCLLWPVRYDHELDRNKRDTCIADQNQREFNHGRDSFVMWSAVMQSRDRHLGRR